MRIANRIIASVIGVLLLAGGVLTAVEIAIAYAGGSRWVLPYDAWYRHARSDSWDSGGVRGLLIAVALIGLTILILQLLRRPPATLTIRSDTDATYSVRRRSVERSLVRSAEGLDGIDTARAKIDRRTVRVKARSNRRLPGDLKVALERSVNAGVHKLELVEPPRVQVSLRLRERQS
jgi:hypothetical protein